MDSGLNQGPLRWSEIAARARKVMHPTVQFGRLADSDDPYGHPDWAYEPIVGHLPEHETLAVAEILREFTSAPVLCYFGFCYGCRCLVLRYEHFPKMSLPSRDYMLFTGPLAAVPELSAEGGFW